MLSTGEIVGTAIGGSVAAYIVTVIILYRCPSILHKRKPYLFDGFLIAHRGGAGEKIENTLDAFRHAVHDTKTDILELDLHLTKDKQVVICHDSDLERTTGVEGIVEETNFADLPPLKQHIGITFDPGNVCQGEHPDTAIPLFEDLLKQLPDTVLNIDLKRGTKELVELVGELLHRYGRTKTVIWGSSVNSVHEMAYAYDPSIPIYFDIKGSLKLIVYFWTGLLAFMPIREQVLELPYVPADVMTRMLGARRLSWGYRFLRWLGNRVLLSTSLVEYLQRRGMQTYVFVLNSEEAWTLMFERGITGIHTDYPTRLRAFLDAHPEYTQRKSATKADETERLVPPSPSAAPPRDDF